MLKTQRRRSPRTRLPNTLVAQVWCRSLLLWWIHARAWSAEIWFAQVVPSSLSTQATVAHTVRAQWSLRTIRIMLKMQRRPLPRTRLQSTLVALDSETARLHSRVPEFGHLQQT